LDDPESVVEGNLHQPTQALCKTPSSDHIRDWNDDHLNFMSTFGHSRMTGSLLIAFDVAFFSPTVP